jgi:mycarose O-acyltransferase
MKGTVENLILVHTWFTNSAEVRQGWNGVSWTLSCELFFYLNAPIIFNYIIHKYSEQIILKYITYLWSITIAISIYAELHKYDNLNNFLWFSPYIHILGFAAGATIAKAILSDKLPVLMNAYKLLLILVTIVLIYLCFNYSNEKKSNVTWLFVYPIFLVIIAKIAQLDINNKITILNYKILITLGEASFCIYMIHAWLIVIYKNILFNLLNYYNVHFKSENEIKEFFFITLIFFIIIISLISYIVHVTYEKYSRKLALKLFSTKLVFMKS